MYAKKCCVPECRSSESRERIFKMHRFPKSEPELFRQWVRNVNNSKLFGMDNDKIYNLHRVCGKHFCADSIVQGTKRGLKRTAVPTLYLPNARQENMYLEMSCRREDQDFQQLRSHETESVKLQGSTGKTIECKSISIDNNYNSCSNEEEMPPQIQYTDFSQPSTPKADVTQTEKTLETQDFSVRRRINKYKTINSGRRPYTSVLAEIGVTRQVELSPKAKHMYRNVIRWSSRARHMQRRITSFQQRLVNAEKLSNSNNLPEIMEKVNRATYNFILSQIRNQSKSSKARRYTLDEKVLALTILKSSGKAYRLLSKIFALPSKGTLSKLLNLLPLHPGVNKTLFKALERSVSKMSSLEKYCSLVFDEMSLSVNVQYNSKEDYIDGIEDFGHTRRPALADHTNVFMVKGIFKSWKQPILFTFSNGPVKSVTLKNQIKEVITACQDIDLKIICSVCDQGATNQSAINLLLKETKNQCAREGVDNRYHGYLVNNEEIVHLYDIPHLFKGIRNNLLKKNLYFIHNDKHMVAKWQHIIQFYHLDVEEENRICHKLTDQHVLRTKINKMKVKNCTQVFSYTVGSLMDRISRWGVPGLAKEASDTASFILFMDKLFDSCNSHSKVAPTSKPLKGALMIDSPHEDFWRDCIRVLKTMRYHDEKKNKFVIVPSLKNLIFTLEGFIHIKKRILANMNNRYICLRDINQDCLENFFSCIRSHGIRNVNPSASLFTKSFKALIINNFMASHSPHSEGPLDNLRGFLTREVSPGVANLTQPSTAELAIPDNILIRRTRVSRCIINYISGYLVKKLTKCTKCKFCLGTISGKSVKDTDMDFIDSRTYENSNLKVPSKLFSFKVGRILSYIFYSLPRLCHLKNISKVLTSIVNENISLSSLNCHEHPEFLTSVKALIIKCSIYFWCRKVNRIASGKDTKFQKFIKKTGDMKLIDPIKLMALKKYENNRKRYQNKHVSKTFNS